MKISQVLNVRVMTAMLAVGTLVAAAHFGFVHSSGLHPLDIIGDYGN